MLLPFVVVGAIQRQHLEVVLPRPLGVTVQEASNGAVFVLAARGNALDAGVRVGDVVVGVSGVYGEVVYSTKNAGVLRVESLIRSRAADTVTLRLERGHEYHLAEETDEFDEDPIDTPTFKSIFDKNELAIELPDDLDVEPDLEPDLEPDFSQVHGYFEDPFDDPPFDEKAAARNIRR